MARLPRYFVKGVPLHIILRGNNREPIFANDEDCQFFKEALLDAAKRHDLAIHAYVFMTNHIHLLATPGAEDSAPKVMQSVGRRYVQYFNFRYRRTVVYMGSDSTYSQYVESDPIILQGKFEGKGQGQARFFSNKGPPISWLPATARRY